MVSALFVISLLQQDNPNLEVESIGAPETVVEQVKVSRYPGFWQVCKIVFVCCICFFGAAFTIMAFHNDIGIREVFGQIYELLTGQEPQSVTALEIAYSIGLALGILVFFNHIGGRRITSDPTPIEVEMRKYETDVNRALTETADRGKKDAGRLKGGKIVILSKLLPVVVGLGAGILVSAGVFTVLLSVGLVPRFAGKTHTGKKKFFCTRKWLSFGTLVGCLASVFPGAVIFGREWLQKRLEAGAAFEWLALTVEAPDRSVCRNFRRLPGACNCRNAGPIPILTRRIGFRHGLGLMVLSIAMGKSSWKPVVFLAPYFCFSVKIPL